MMPPGGAVGRADHSATLESVTHERLTDPEIGRLLDVLEPWAAGEDPGRRRRPARGGDAARLREGGPRPHEPGGGDEPRGLARRRRLAGGARGGGLLPLPRRARPSPRAARPLRRVLPRRRASLRRGARRLRARDDDGAGPPAAGRARRRTGAARRGRDGAGGRGRPPARRGVRGRGPAARGDGAARGRRLRSRPLAPGRLAAPVRAGDRRRRRPRDHALRHPQLRRGVLRRAARVRPRPLRGEHPRPPQAHSARAPGVARRARVPEPAVGEHRRPRAAVLHLGPRLAGARAPGDRRRHDAGRAVPRAQPGRAEPDPRRLRRDDVQPPHRPAVRARGRADGGRTRGRRPSARLERGDAPAARARRPRRRPGRPAGRPLGRRDDRLLPHLQPRQPHGGAAVERPAAPSCPTSASGSSGATSRRCASGSTTACTSTAASSRRRSCCAARPARSWPSPRSWTTCARSCATRACWPPRPEPWQPPAKAARRFIPRCERKVARRVA